MCPCLQSGICSKRLIRLNIETRVPVCWENIIYRLLQNLPNSSLDLRYGATFWVAAELCCLCKQYCWPRKGLLSNLFVLMLWDVTIICISSPAYICISKKQQCIIVATEVLCRCRGYGIRTHNFKHPRLYIQTLILMIQVAAIFLSVKGKTKKKKEKEKWKGGQTCCSQK